jgi:small subunit ribosomal protein S17
MTQESVRTQGKRKESVGTVVSDKMQKTIVVEIIRLVRDPLYGKTTKRKAKFKVHDEKNDAHCGDRVRIEETRPMSKDKRWRLIEIISKAKSLEGADDL